MRQIDAVILFVLGMIAVFAGVFWGFYAFAASHSALPTSPSAVDFVIIAVLLIIGFSLISKCYKISRPWSKVRFALVGLVFGGMALFFTWAGTPLSSCYYFPINRHDCGSIPNWW
jgi:hypothetical protein